MKRKSYVYKHSREDKDEVFYIGIGCTKNYKRAYSQYNRNKWWRHIVNKTEYKVEIIKEGLTWDEACILEIELIKKYGRKDLNEGSLVNMTDGGDGTNGLLFSDEYKYKMKKRWDDGTHHLLNEEVRERARKSLCGRSLTECTKNKISESQMGKNNYWYGKKRPEHSKWISKNRTGENHPMYGQSHSEEARKKISEKTKGKNNPRWLGYIKITDLNSNEYVFETSKDAARKFDMGYRVIRNKCKNNETYKKGKYKNWKFELIKNKNKKQ